MGVGNSKQAVKLSNNLNYKETEQIMTVDVFNLHMAIMRNDTESVKNLAQAGVNLDAPWMNVKNPSAKDGTTALCEAISLNHTEVVRILLHHGVNVNKPDIYGYTPLHKASYHARINIVKILIESGADLLQTDIEGDTALHLACKMGILHPTKQLTSLLQIFINSKFGIVLLNKKNKRGKVPLHISAELGNPVITKLLVEFGSPIDSMDMLWQTPLSTCLYKLLTFNHTSSRKIDPINYIKCLKVLLIDGHADPLNMQKLFFSKSLSPFMLTFSLNNHFLNPFDMDRYNYNYFRCNHEEIEHIHRMICENHGLFSSMRNNDMPTSSSHQNQSELSGNNQIPTTSLRRALSPLPPHITKSIKNYIEDCIKRRSFRNHSSNTHHHNTTANSASNQNTIHASDNMTTFFGSNHNAANFLVRDNFSLRGNTAHHLQRSFNHLNQVSHSTPPLSYLIPILMHDKELWAKLTQSYPLSLKHLCRLRIKSCMNTHNYEKFVKNVQKHIKLPQSLKDYVVRAMI